MSDPSPVHSGGYCKGGGEVDEWMAKVQAPQKKLVWFEHGSHMVYEEEPSKFLVVAVNEVLPLTRPK